MPVSHIFELTCTGTAPSSCTQLHVPGFPMATANGWCRVRWNRNTMLLQTKFNSFSSRLPLLQLFLFVYHHDYSPCSLDSSISIKYIILFCIFENILLYLLSCDRYHLIVYCPSSGQNFKMSFPDSQSPSHSFHCLDSKEFIRVSVILSFPCFNNFLPLVCCCPAVT